MNNSLTITFARRCFLPDELTLIRQAAADCAGLGITEIARTICEWLDWKRPNGRLKNHECRLLLERLRDQGLLTLPALHRSGRRGPRTVSITVESDPQLPIQTTVAGLQPLRLVQVPSTDGALFRQFIQRYHYLGYRIPTGANLRYFVQAGSGQLLACLQWSSPAWTMAARDRWIGWTTQQRARNLQYVVNNSRFLIVPWVRVKGWRLRFWHAPPTGSSTIGANNMDTRRCCWKLSLTPHDSTEPVIVQQTGSSLARLLEEAAWISTTEITLSRKRSSCSRCAAAFSKHYATAIPPLFQSSMKK